MLGRIAQLAMMAAYRASWPVLQRLVPLLAELAQVGGDEDLRRIVVYIATTTRERERWQGGGELMNKTEEMIEIYGDMREREGRQEGELRGKVQTIERLVGREQGLHRERAGTCVPGGLPGHNR